MLLNLPLTSHGRTLTGHATASLDLRRIAITAASLSSKAIYKVPARSKSFLAFSYLYRIRRRHSQKWLELMARIFLGPLDSGSTRLFNIVFRLYLIGWGRAIYSPETRIFCGALRSRTEG